VEYYGINGFTIHLHNRRKIKVNSIKDFEKAANEIVSRIRIAALIAAVRSADLSEKVSGRNGTAL
jgi:hypothetical protein